MPVRSGAPPGCPLEQLLARLGGVLTPVHETPELLRRPVSGVLLHLPEDPAPKDRAALVLLADPVQGPGWRPPEALLDPRHPEYGQIIFDEAGQIPRSVYAQASLKI